MASDLLSIGSSGVLAQQKLLYTTSNNISNVNTQGVSNPTTTTSQPIDGIAPSSSAK